MTLYQPMNGWDGTIAVADSGDTVFTDASEVYEASFAENFNIERRKQLGTHSPGYMPGRYEATGAAKGYFITGAMASKIYGVAPGADLSVMRDHAARPQIQFNLKIDFHNFPIQVRAPASSVNSVGQLQLVGYIMSGCLIDTDAFDMIEGTYIEKPFTFKVQRVIDVYQTDAPADLVPFIV